jgi:hypothetical protein
MGWEFDAPSGTYRDHFLSADIRRQAMANTHFARFLRPERGFGKGKGAFVNITRWEQLPPAARVSELDRLPVGNPAITVKKQAVSEWGWSVERTQFEKDVTHYQLEAQDRKMLTDQMKITMDAMAAEALKSTPLVAVATGASTLTISTGGAAGSQANANLSVDHLRILHDELSGDLKAPPFQNEMYIGILSTQVARGIKNDTTYQAWQAPTTAEPFHKGRWLKPIEGFMLFETNNFAALENALGTTNQTGQAIFFGADAGFLAVVRNPEIRIGKPEDLGRFHKMGWVGTLDAGLVWDQADKARVIKWSSNDAADE